MKLEDLPSIDRERVLRSLKIAKRVGAGFKGRRGSLAGLAAHIMKQYPPVVSLHVHIDEEEGLIEWSGLADWPENWREMEKFKNAWFNVPSPTATEVWNDLTDYQRRFAARLSPGRFLAEGIDISPYLSPEDLRKLQ